MPPPGRAAAGPRARFDDVAGGAGLVLSGFERAVVAKSCIEVAGAITEAERAAAAGHWVGGFVAYEAAAGLDPTLAVRTSSLAPDVAVPLVWFGVFRHACSEPLRNDTDTVEPHWELDMDQRDHARRVAAVRAAIASGDVYQCNLTARYRSEVDGDPLDLYRRLASAQPRRPLRLRRHG